MYAAVACEKSKCGQQSVSAITSESASSGALTGYGMGSGVDETSEQHAHDPRSVDSVRVEIGIEDGHVETEASR